MAKRRYFGGVLILALLLAWLLPACAPPARAQQQGPAKAEAERAKPGPSAQDRPASRPTSRESKPAEVTVTIFSTGDLHEHTTQLARIAGYVKAAKKKDPNVLFMDAGDMFGGYGEREMGITKGEAMFALMTPMGYDACILGNWDYIHGKARIFELCRKFPKFPLLMANVKWAEQDKENAKLIPPYRIFELKGVKVGVIGTGSHDMRYARRGRFAIYYQPAVIHQFVPRLRKQADIVIALTHQYEGDDYATASGPDAPDLIVGGHSHGAYVRPYGKGNKSYIVKGGPYGRQLGVVKITWDGRKITDRQGKLLRVQKDWPEDPEVKALRAKFMKAGAKKPKKAATRPKKGR